jgi:hypothetical protein
MTPRASLLMMASSDEVTIAARSVLSRSLAGQAPPSPAGAPLGRGRRAFGLYHGNDLGKAEFRI